MLKTGKQEKLYPPTDVSVSQQCRPQLRSVKFEDLVHNIFRNENLTLEINVSHFGVLHWEQWQPPASAPVEIVNATKNYRFLFSAKILTTSSISALFLLLLFLPFLFLPTDFGAPFKASALTDAPHLIA